MIVYFDISALVPLLTDEPASEACRELWDDSDGVITVRLAYVEAAAALAQARRLRKISDAAHQDGLRLLDRFWGEFQIIEVDDLLVRRAAEVAQDCALRGYDAVHCAGAESVAADDLLVASGDRKLLDACRSLRLATADIHDLEV